MADGRSKWACPGDSEEGLGGGDGVVGHDEPRVVRKGCSRTAGRAQSTGDWTNFGKRKGRRKEIGTRPLSFRERSGWGETKVVLTGAWMRLMGVYILFRKRACADAGLCGGGKIQRTSPLMPSASSFQLVLPYNLRGGEVEDTFEPRLSTLWHDQESRVGFRLGSPGHRPSARNIISSQSPSALAPGHLEDGGVLPRWKPGDSRTASPSRTGRTAATKSAGLGGNSS